MAEKLRVYTSTPTFTNPQLLQIFALEKGIEDDVEEVVYDTSPGGNRRKWPHLKVNPWDETPTLEVADRTYLAETAAILHCLAPAYPGRKVTGEMPLEQGRDATWDARIRVDILYRIVTIFHAMHEGLGFETDLTHDQQWGEYCRMECALPRRTVGHHLSDGRDWSLGGDEPTFPDVTLCAAIAFSKFPVNNTTLDERFEYLDYYRDRWK